MPVPGVAAAVADGSVTTAKLAAGAVAADKLAADSVTSAKIAANAVTSAKLAASAVTADKLAADAITAGKLAANAVTPDKLASDRLALDRVMAGAMAADATGKIGIGKASPGTALDVNGTSFAERTEPDNSTEGRTVTVQGGHASSSGVPFQAQPGGGLLLQAGDGYNLDFIDPIYRGGDVVVRSGANWIKGLHSGLDGGDIVFQTGGASNTFTEHLRILGRNGRIGVNTADPQAGLDVVSGID